MSMIRCVMSGNRGNRSIKKIKVKTMMELREWQSTLWGL